LFFIRNVQGEIIDFESYQIAKSRVYFYIFGKESEGGDIAAPVSRLAMAALMHGTTRQNDANPHGQWSIRGFVIPAEAGIFFDSALQKEDSRFRGNDK